MESIAIAIATMQRPGMLGALLSHLQELQLPAVTQHTITTRDDLVEHLHEVRDTGWAIDAEEAGIGMRCFAVALPFQTPSKDAISCSVPIARLDAAKEQKIIELLLEARDQLAHQFDRRIRNR